MLHIILGILKVIGIFLAVLLCVAAAVILSVLFVPVRYRGVLKKTPETAGAEVKVSWFLHFITFYLTFDLEQKRTAWNLRICGLTLDTILNGIKKFTAIAGKLKKVRKSNSCDSSEIMQENESMDDTEEDSAKDAKNEIEIQEEIEKDKINEDNTEDINTEDINTEDIKAEDIDVNIQQDVSESAKEAKAYKDESAVYEEKNRDDENISDTDKESVNFSTVIFNIIEKIKHVFHRILDKVNSYRNSVNDKKNAAQNKVKNLSDKIQYYLGLGEKYEVKLLLGEILTELLLLLRHYMPGKLSGYLHFGCGDPALTGELTGLIYLMLPADSAGFQVLPEFTEKVFDAEISMKGKIRACHAVWLAWKLYRNKKLMLLIRELRKARRSY